MIWSLIFYKIVQLKVVTYSKPLSNVEMTLKKKTIISHRPCFFPSLCLFYSKSRWQVNVFSQCWKKIIKTRYWDLGTELFLKLQTHEKWEKHFFQEEPSFYAPSFIWNITNHSFLLVLISCSGHKGVRIQALNSTLGFRISLANHIYGAVMCTKRRRAS